MAQTTPRREPAPAGRPVRPILVMMVYRGGERFKRALASLEQGLSFFDRMVLSITSAPDSPDVQAAQEFADRVGDRCSIDVLCTQRELPTMAHQEFWIDHLEHTGARGDDWILWLAYDDQLRIRGLEHIVDVDGNWSLHPDTAYFGPWAMRHESAGELWQGDATEPLDSWTSFPLTGPVRLPVVDWVGAQLLHPTYMQMSGSVCLLRSHRALVRGILRKGGPMRIEMATALGLRTRWVAEFSEPISIIYGRPNSDRASYGRAARREDWHLLAALTAYVAWHPAQWPAAARWTWRLAGQAWAIARGQRPAPAEDWVCRDQVPA